MYIYTYICIYIYIYIFFFLAMAFDANDVYLNISQVLSRGFIALAGDSHAREVSGWMRPLREDNDYGGLRLHQNNGHVQGFVRGGMTSFQYYHSVLYIQLKKQ